MRTWLIDQLVPRSSALLTIGVNDIGRGFTPDYLFVMDSPQAFGPERFHYIRDSRAKYIFTDHDLGVERPTSFVSDSKQPAARFDDPDMLYLIGRPPTSPFLALCLARITAPRPSELLEWTSRMAIFSPATALTSWPTNCRESTSGSTRWAARFCTGRQDFQPEPRESRNGFSAWPGRVLRFIQERPFPVLVAPARRICLRAASPPDENLSTIARLINSHTTLSCRLIGPGSPDIGAKLPPIEERVLADSAIKIDCDEVSFPPVAADDRASCKPGTIACDRCCSDAPRWFTPTARRPLTVTAIVSQEGATGDEVAESVRSLWPDLLSGDDLIVLAGNPPVGRTPRWLLTSPKVNMRSNCRAKVRSRRATAWRVSPRQISWCLPTPMCRPAAMGGSASVRLPQSPGGGGGAHNRGYVRGASKGFGMKWANPQLKTVWLPKAGDAPYAVPLLTGVFLAVRRRVFHELDGFDAGMSGSGGEDQELCLRLWRSGYECHVARASKCCG